MTAHLSGERLRPRLVRRRRLRQLPLQLAHGPVQLQPQPVTRGAQAAHVPLQPPHLSHDMIHHGYSIDSDTEIV
jgi:hypothetical protein